jgi:hypothetical protein
LYRPCLQTVDHADSTLEPRPIWRSRHEAHRRGAGCAHEHPAVSTQPLKQWRPDAQQEQPGHQTSVDSSMASSEVPRRNHIAVRRWNSCADDVWVARARTLNPRINEPRLPSSGVDRRQCSLPAPMAVRIGRCGRSSVVICRRFVRVKCGDDLVLRLCMLELRCDHLSMPGRRERRRFRLR